MGLGETGNIKISNLDFITENWSLFLLDRQLANPNFSGPGFKATSPDRRTRTSCLKDAFSQKVTLCVLT